MPLVTFIRTQCILKFRWMMLIDDVRMMCGMKDLHFPTTCGVTSVTLLFDELLRACVGEGEGLLRDSKTTVYCSQYSR